MRNLKREQGGREGISGNATHHAQRLGASGHRASQASRRGSPSKLLVVPSDARASVAPYGLKEGGPYTPSIPASRCNTNRDFQNGSRG
jgi:hypothetical protein